MSPAPAAAPSLLPLPALLLPPSDPTAGSARVRLPAELGIALASAVRVKLEFPACQDSSKPPVQLSLLCWADVIPRQPEGGIFEEAEAGGRNAVSVDFKTLSSTSSLEALFRSSLCCRRRRHSSSSSSPLLLVDVRPLGKAGRVPSATRVVVRQEPLPQSSAKGSGGSASENGGASVPISSEALSVVLSNALIEAGAAVFPAGVASFAEREEGGGDLAASASLCLLRIVEVESSARGGGASRVVRSTRIDLA